MKTREQAVAEKGAWGNPDTMSANPKEDNMSKQLKISRWVWTVQDEAIHRGVNYAEHTQKILAEQDWQPLLHTLLKEAYQQGFLHGFEHKFDDTNYEGDK